LNIPDDIAVMGFSNNKITSLIDPQLTTVDQPSFEMGRKSAEILINMIEDKFIKPMICVLDTKLIIRGST
jgi:DNA-binding LacI/PurR family transcriptional regulator